MLNLSTPIPKIRICLRIYQASMYAWASVSHFWFELHIIFPTLIWNKANFCRPPSRPEWKAKESLVCQVLHNSGNFDDDLAILRWQNVLRRPGWIWCRAFNVNRSWNRIDRQATAAFTGTEFCTIFTTTMSGHAPHSLSHHNYLFRLRRWSG